MYPNADMVLWWLFNFNNSRFATEYTASIVESYHPFECVCQTRSTFPLDSIVKQAQLPAFQM